MSVLIGAKSCRSCEWRLKIPQAPAGSIFCRRYPPQVFTMPIQTEGGVQWGNNATYPLVNADYPCGEYERSALYAAEELAEAGKGMTPQ